MYHPDTMVLKTRGRLYHSIRAFHAQARSCASRMALLWRTVCGGRGSRFSARFQVSVLKFQVSRIQVPDSRHQVLKLQVCPRAPEARQSAGVGILVLASGFRFEVRGLSFEVSGFNFEVSGFSLEGSGLFSRFQVSGFSCQLSCSRFEVPGSRFQGFRCGA